MLVNVDQILTVVDNDSGCRIFIRGCCLEVAESFDEVIRQIVATIPDLPMDGAWRERRRLAGGVAHDPAHDR
jgi:hypothetical protein